MSTQIITKRVSVPELRGRKSQEKIVGLTAHSCNIARVIDDYVDFILVGDSTAMVAYGHTNTLSITVDQLAAHGAAVVNATVRACVVVDMPFGSYQESPELAFRNAAKIISISGASAVKIEGGAVLATTVKFLVDRGIPVVAHVGLMPQYLNTLGGFRAQGLDEASAQRIIEDALAHEAAGAFVLVLEGIGEPLARRITGMVSIPTIGIGASPACDGQILVSEDVLGLSGSEVPRFVKQYLNGEALVRAAVEQYSVDVKNGAFPEKHHCFGFKAVK
ncbi:3-methyl-2-oxobutanoate hydroxymethyltransferase [Pseudomonas putida]|uniref:3-methyl-2-oxobutanoate hydroxymethyltransferase n=1 Tax=Pseudomonas putida TaxID=303 RepID=UPI0039067E5E